MSNKSGIVRIGVIGCGKVAEERHLPALRFIPAVRVVAAADIDADRLSRVADQFGIDQRFTDYHAMLERDDVDAVAVLTPSQLHAEMGLAVLDTDKHLFIEKPLALTLADCDRLIARAMRFSRVAMVGFNLRWHRLVRRARAIVASGALGQIKAIRSAYTHARNNRDAPEWHRQRALGGGIILNEAVHHFDLWCFLLGSEVTQILAVSESSAQYEDETSVVNARMTSGVLAAGVFSLKTSPNSEVEIYGELGRLSLACYKFDGLEFFADTTYPGDIADRLRKMGNTLKEMPEVIPILRRGGDVAETFRAEWIHFVYCIRESRTPECTLQDGRRSLEIALAALDSISLQRAMQVAET